MRLFNFTADNCKNCNKCIRECPVKAIRFRDSKAEIDEEKCIACGKCFTICPKHARNMENEIETVTAMIASNKKVIACIDSAYLGSFKIPGQYVAALRKFGFDSVEEVAAGSENITKSYIDYINKNIGKQKYFITSTCPSIYLFIQKYHPELTKYLIPVVLPMVALGKGIKAVDPDAYTVYVGPCLSKKIETMPKISSNPINSLITCQEITRMFRRKFIDLESLEPEAPDRMARNTGTSYSIAGDMWPCITEILEKANYNVLSVNGLENVKLLFEAMEKGTIGNSYIGISACVESCINGPFIPYNSLDLFCRRQKITNFAKEQGWQLKNKVPPIKWEEIDCSRSFEPLPIKKEIATKEEIEAILVKMGRHTKSDEYDCAACGYNTCREKAQAVFEGMADIEMCWPNLRKAAERKGDTIFVNSRNSIILLDGEEKVLQINPAAEVNFKIKNEEIQGKHVKEIFPEAGEIYKECLIEKQDVLNRKVNLKEYDMVVMENIVYIEGDELYISMQNITEEESRKEELARLKLHTIEIAQKVSEKQMRVAQEIASLLGETTAETKVALNKFKDIVLKEGE